jgi:integrase
LSRHSSESLVTLTVPAELARLLGPLARPAAPVPLGRWRDEVVAEYRSRARTTRTRMGQALGEALALAGQGATTEALTPALVARFAARPGRAATTNGLLSSLRAACNLAGVKGWISPSALQGASWTVRDPDPPRARHHGRAAIARVLGTLRAGSDTWEGGRLFALAAILSYCGLRKTEALRLRVEDVDLGRGFLFVRPNGRELKTAASAAPVPCPAALVEVLRDWLPRCGSEWVVPNLNRRGPWTGGAHGRRAADRLRAAGEEAGVVAFTPHSLRHSLATHLAGHWRLGSKQIQMVLRHSNRWTQATYIHPDLVNLRAMVRGFDFADRPRRAPRRRKRPSPKARPMAYRASA